MREHPEQRGNEPRTVGTDTLIPKQCVVCGHDHDRDGELCPRCQEDTADEYDRMPH